MGLTFEKCDFGVSKDNLLYDIVINIVNDCKRVLKIIFD